MAWDDWIGRSEVRSDTLTPQLHERFCATFDLERGEAFAPQGIHWCLCLPDPATAILGPDGHPRRDLDDNSFLPPIPLPRRMWASSKVEFLAPIGVGAAIERTSTIVGIAEKTGSSGQLVFVEIEHDIMADEELSVKDRQTIVYREPRGEATAGKSLGEPPEWQLERTIIPSETLLFRYSALTFNSHRIHYDLPYATQEEGYRGLVVHGPLTATLLLDLAALQFGSNALATCDFRAQSPAIAGKALHLVGTTVANRVVLYAIGADGRVVLSATAHAKVPQR